MHSIDETWKPTNEALFKTYYEKGLKNTELASKFNVDTTTLLYYINTQQLMNQLQPRMDFLDKPTGVTDSSDLDEKLTRTLRASQGTLSINDLANRNGVSPKAVEEAVERLQLGGFLVQIKDGYVGIQNPARLELSDYYLKATCGVERKIGVVADTHLCNQYCDEKLLNGIYDIFEDEGITDVFHCGNWIEGEERFNWDERTVFGFENQVNYFIDNYPARKGITTHIIDGKDHEGWTLKREHIMPGKVMESFARMAGRDDLVHLGFITRDVMIPAGNGYTRVRVEHPGGGSTQNISGKPQSIVNGIRNKVHPDIYLMGHYHKKLYMEHNGVHTIMVPCTCEQTTFMYTKVLDSVMGGLVLSFTQDDDGSVLMLDPKFLPGGSSRPWEHKRL